MAQYITNLAVSLNQSEESEYRDQGYKKLAGDLNKGAGGAYIYLWYKLGTCSPITRIQFSFTDDMGKGLSSAGYEKINKNLNTGSGGDCIYLWCYRGSTEYDFPITELHISTEPEDGAHHFREGWDRIACDLNRSCGGNWIYLFVKRETPTYICDVTATDGYYDDEEKAKNGYIRVDEDTNRKGKGAYVFVWYRLTTDQKKAIRDVKISVTDEQYDNYQKQNYKLVNTNLNAGTDGHEIYMWFKKDKCESNPIKAISVLVNPEAFKAYEHTGVTVVQENLNTGNGGEALFLCFNN